MLRGVASSGRAGGRSGVRRVSSSHALGATQDVDGHRGDRNDPISLFWFLVLRDVCMGPAFSLKLAQLFSPQNCWRRAIPPLPPLAIFVGPGYTTGGETFLFSSVEGIEAYVERGVDLILLHCGVRGNVPAWGGVVSTVCSCGSTTVATDARPDGHTLEARVDCKSVKVYVLVRPSTTL